jgi:hypothetical protein
MGGPTQDGSEAFPYLIEDFNDFQVFCDDPNYWAENIHTQLNCDLDLDPNLSGRQIYTTAVIAADTNNTNSDFDGISFEGIFDGNGHTIIDLFIDTQGVENDYLGLFGQIIGPTAEIKNLGIADVRIIGSYYSYHLGGLCGKNDGKITNCYSTGSIISGTDSDNLGGLCGYNYGIITKCYATCAITGKHDTNNLGGLCGYNNGQITQCFATGPVNGGSDASNLGGFCGYNNDFILNCFSTSPVTGSIDDASRIGGFCGINYGHIKNCYSIGLVRGDSDLRVGGFCATNYAAITKCFWDIATSHRRDGVANQTPDPNGVMGKTTAEMKTPTTFLDADWDLVTIWNIEQGQTYPLLRKYSAFDTNYDNKVNFIDFAEFANNWLSGDE